MKSTPPKTTSKYLRSEIAGNITGDMASNGDKASTGVSVLCTFQNSSDKNLTYAINHDWNGRISKPPYRKEVYQHVAENENGESESAVVYEFGTVDWMVCWSAKNSGENHVYTEIGPHGFFNNDTPWDDYKDLLDRASDTSTTNYKGYSATVEIEKGTTSVELMAKIEKI